MDIELWVKWTEIRATNVNLGYYTRGFRAPPIVVSHRRGFCRFSGCWSSGPSSSWPSLHAVVLLRGSLVHVSEFTGSGSRLFRYGCESSFLRVYRFDPVCSNRAVSPPSESLQVAISSVLLAVLRWLWILDFSVIPPTDTAEGVAGVGRGGCSGWLARAGSCWALAGAPFSARLPALPSAAGGWLPGRVAALNQP